MYKYNIGDTVRIVGYAVLCFGAANYRNRTAKIIKQDRRNWSDGTTNAYFVDCDDGYYCWKEDWLEKE